MSIMGLYISYQQTTKNTMTLLRDILYNSLIEYGIPMKLVTFKQNLQ